MKHYLCALFCCLFCLKSISQSLCGTANENGTITLTAPSGKVFTSVKFASYGTPTGVCGSFVQGSCHATSSQSQVQSAFVGQNSATIAATNTVFGDPCGGTVKQLFIEVNYGTVLPLKLLYFSAQVGDLLNVLQWKTTSEENTQAFEVERSTDALQFVTIATLPSQNRSGVHAYAFTDHQSTNQSWFYRLKMVDQDGKFTYSRVISCTHKTVQGSIKFYPNPTAAVVYLNDLRSAGMVELMTADGKTLVRKKVTGPSLSINMSGFAAGTYLIRYYTATQASYQTLVKQ